MSDEKTPPAPRYYIRDTRQVVGNCALWWRPEGAGYATDLNEAGEYSADEALSTERDSGRTHRAIPIEVARAGAVTHVRVERLREFETSSAVDAKGPLVVLGIGRPARVVVADSTDRVFTAGEVVCGTNAARTGSPVSPVAMHGALLRECDASAGGRSLPADNAKASPVDDSDNSTAMYTSKKYWI